MQAYISISSMGDKIAVPSIQCNPFSETIPAKERSRYLAISQLIFSSISPDRIAHATSHMQ